jgi:dihydrofolate synthase / folylpolyglutamate synthase
VSHTAYLLALEQLGVKLGLHQIRGLLSALGRPEEAFRSIVVAGTNGKGSVSAMLERGLRAAGYRTGRYTSPHLVSLTERVAIDGRPISGSDLEHLAGRVRVAADRLATPPTFFEATTALALEAFRDAEVDVAVLEVGLGGRLDATNAVDASAAAVTAIDFDHEAHLGETLAAIAAEKAGVIKRGAIAVLAANPPVVQDVVRRACAKAGARYVFAPESVTVEATMADGRAQLALVTPRAAYDRMTLSLRGRHQVENAVAAIRLLEEVSAHGLMPVPPDAVRTAVTDVSWPARLELLRWRGVDVLIDGAHNPAGARALAAYLAETYARPLPIVVGAMRDKKIPALVEALATAASCFVFTAPATARAATSDELKSIAAAAAPHVPAETSHSPMDALTRAAMRGAPIVVAGSLYLAGEVRAEIS